MEYSDRIHQATTAVVLSGQFHSWTPLHLGFEVADFRSCFLTVFNAQELLHFMGLADGGKSEFVKLVGTDNIVLLWHWFGSGCRPGI